MKLAPTLILRLAIALMGVVSVSTAAIAEGGDNPGQDSGGSYGSAAGPSLVRTEQRTYERCRELPKLVGDKSFPDGAISYGEHGETKKKKDFPVIPGKIWPIVTQPYQPQGPEKMAAWAKVMDEITGYSKNPQIGEVNLSPAFCALAMANAGQMLADTLQNPQENLSRAREEQNQQTQQAADNCAAMERQQAGCAIDFVASYLSNFTVDNGNKWNKVRNQLFLPMALLLLLPGAVLAQVKSIVSQGFPVLGEISPWEGIIRSIVAIFLIPGTYLVINYGIDLSNSITFSISDQYQKIFGTDMYEDAMCAHIRAFPYREPSENKNFVPDQEAKMTKLSPNDTPFANLEAKMINVKLLDPCAGLNIVPPDRANEQVKYSVNAQRSAYNQANAALAMTWNILCAFQMAYLYYLWFVGPVVAALWVYPMKQLRDAFPSWCEGVLTLCFWSLFWNTVVLLMACFRGVDETGTIMITALNFLSTACVKFAFDFAGLVKDAGREAGKMAEKMSASGGGGKGSGNSTHNPNGAHSGTGTAPSGHGPGVAPPAPMNDPGGHLAAGSLNGSGVGAGGQSLGSTMAAGSSGMVNGGVSMTGFPAPPSHGSHFAAGLGTGLGIGLGTGALLAGAVELAHHHAHHSPGAGGAPSGGGVAGAGNGAGGEGTRGVDGGSGGAGGAGGIGGPGGAGAGAVDAGGVDGTGATFDVSHEGDLYDIDHDIDFGASSAALAASGGDSSTGVSGGLAGSMPPLSTEKVPLSLTPGDVSNIPPGTLLPPLTTLDNNLGNSVAGASNNPAAGLPNLTAGDLAGGHAAGSHSVGHTTGGHGAHHITGAGHGEIGHGAGGHVPGGLHNVSPPGANSNQTGNPAGQPDPTNMMRNANGANTNQGSMPPTAQQIASAQQQAEALYRDSAQQAQQSQIQAAAAGALSNNSYVDYSVTGAISSPMGTGAGSGSNNFTADPGYLSGTSSNTSGYDPSAASFTELARSVAGDPNAASIIDGREPISNDINNVVANADYSNLSTYGGADPTYSNSYDSTYSSSSYDSSTSYSNYDTSNSVNSSTTNSQYSAYSNTDTVGGAPIINSQLPGANADTASMAPPPSSSFTPSTDSYASAASSQYGPQITPASPDISTQSNALQSGGYSAPQPDSQNMTQNPYVQSTPAAGSTPISIDSYSTNNSQGSAPQHVEARISGDHQTQAQSLPAPGANVQQIAGVAGAAALFGAAINTNSGANRVSLDARKQAAMGQLPKQQAPRPGSQALGRGPGAPVGGKQSKLGAALGRGPGPAGSRPQPQTKGAQYPARGAEPPKHSPVKNVNDPMNIDAGNTLRRYRAARKMSPEELAELEKSARDSGQDWMPC